ncbi:gamma-glutamylcyclotransferase [Phaeovulum sp.]|uniref:gamma-glutamylcyclotransferase n=1 Tax=Phaeovulum sp. TaxID=2934796 RepID=UPI0039E71995
MNENQTNHTPLWIFGYGSLIWNPGFQPAEALPARLIGWQRSFCMRSITYRGTDIAPGLVLALDSVPSSACAGLAFRAAPGSEDEVLAYLRARELISSAYLERNLPVMLNDGRQVNAITFVIDHQHPQYWAGLTPEDQAQIIARARGDRGPNVDYLFNTARHLHELGLPDPELDWLVTRVTALKG